MGESVGPIEGPPSITSCIASAGVMNHSATKITEEKEKLVKLYHRSNNFLLLTRKIPPEHLEDVAFRSIDPFQFDAGRRVCRICCPRLVTKQPSGYRFDGNTNH